MKDLEGFKLPAQTAPKPRTRTLVDSLVTVQETGRAGFTGVQERDMAKSVKAAGFCNWRDYR